MSTNFKFGIKKNINRSIKNTKVKIRKEGLAVSRTESTQQYPPKNTLKTNKKTVSNFSDKLLISSMGKDYNIARTALSSAPDIREDLIYSIKERIKNGTYEVSGEAFAEKILDNFFRRPLNPNIFI